MATTDYETEMVARTLAKKAFTQSGVRASSSMDYNDAAERYADLKWPEYVGDARVDQAIKASAV